MARSFFAGMCHARPAAMNGSAKNVGNPERWVSVIAGSAIAAYGLSRRTLPGVILAALGGALVWRGGTGHCLVYESLGLSTASQSEPGQAAPAVTDDRV